MYIYIFIYKYVYIYIKKTNVYFYTHTITHTHHTPHMHVSGESINVSFYFLHLFQVSPKVTAEVLRSRFSPQSSDQVRPLQEVSGIADRTHRVCSVAKFRATSYCY